MLEEEPVLVREVGAEALVEHSDDFGKRDLFFLGLAGAHIGRAVDPFRLAWLEGDLARVNPFEPVLLTSCGSCKLARRWESHDQDGLVLFV